MPGRTMPGAVAPAVRRWLDAEAAWQLRGACRRADPDLFFHPDGERGEARDVRDAAAKQICATCPVLQQCREHALTTPEATGVWGGMSEAERATARFYRPRPT